MAKSSQLGVLNPRLFNLLQRRFHHVRVSNSGEAAQFGRRINTLKNNREETFLTYPGEYYQVSCPYCSDTRFRLFINHRFGSIDESGNSFLHAAHCFNENCLAKPGRVGEFIEDLTELHTSLKTCRILEGKQVDIKDFQGSWPGEVIRVDKLPRSHQVVRYLASRNFDVNIIGKFYNVHYCEESSRFWLASNRIIIPIYLDGKFVGWQARLPREHKGKKDFMKYYTCPGTPRMFALYNFANTQRYRTGVIVEGPTDVWSFGPMACCTLGATMTVPQRRKFIRAFAKRSAVLLYDPEEMEKPKVKQLIAELHSAIKGGLAVIKLPEGTDPGSLDRRFLRSFVAQEAKAQGVKVSWKKV